MAQFILLLHHEQSDAGDFSPEEMQAVLQKYLIDTFLASNPSNIFKRIKVDLIG